VDQPEADTATVGQCCFLSLLDDRGFVFGDTWPAVLDDDVDSLTVPGLFQTDSDYPLGAVRTVLIPVLTLDTVFDGVFRQLLATRL
jgi:hypothetical protein